MYLGHHALQPAAQEVAGFDVDLDMYLGHHALQPAAQEVAGFDVDLD
eukprot:CAMPEP_0206214700 /NCGR_PEP_ID=MMETSP0047_2-20121206/1807_1 /ASSEMBLY_ACC=CAM_ASM_000192 /TAXON_ID=195065 /ORGANISM="Chroomonas mesostigmatica_cf, Strain CCMP1168" /LENGTH=46 /DNA_ID= /DNA_START= /DNA_END= /DNA_ORIENTATION=